ncbi:MAG: type II toxin-antitoxin system HicA family toxin [Lachnospiraceae bacterium]|nr:type II toxin-antitoxin system HicA family toxin [Lachnospiraceae bacterium]
MTQFEKLYRKIIIEGNTSVSFWEIQFFIEKLGFLGRRKGDHFIYTMDGVNDIINIQPDGKAAKKYQVKQIKHIVEKYKLGGDSIGE